MAKIKIIDSRLKAWQDLMDISIYFALAGIRLKGYSEKKSWNLLYKNWIKSSQEHKQANLKIAERLYAQRDKGNNK